MHITIQVAADRHQVQPLALVLAVPLLGPVARLNGKSILYNVNTKLCKPKDAAGITPGGIRGGAVPGGACTRGAPARRDDSFASY